MKTELIVALIAGAFSSASAGTAFVSSWQISANSRAIELLKIENAKAQTAVQRQREMSKFSEPLARSAYDLQSRIYNILEQGFVDVYLTNGDERRKTYAINNTAFLIAQYFCYVELARQEIRFIDLGENNKTRELQALQDSISARWLTDAEPPVFMIFSGEQRAIGEALIKQIPQGQDCMGYGEFLKKFPSGAEPLIDYLRADVNSLANDVASATARLKKIQNSLIDLLNLLDPDFLRFPEARRSKI